MGGPYMKSTDNHTKRKALVEVFFCRELVSHSRITIAPQGSFLALHPHSPDTLAIMSTYVCMWQKRRSAIT